MATKSLHSYQRLCCPPLLSYSTSSISNTFRCRFSALSQSEFCPPLRQSNVAYKRRHACRYPLVRALEFDQDTLVAVSVGLVSIAIGIGIPVFYEIQIKNAENRENDQPCFPCKGSGAQTCRFCLGAGTITVELEGGESETSKCVNCEGAGSLTCTTCQGTGVQPRYLDRREYKDDD